MKISPFVYGTTVSDTAFTDRESDSAKLYGNLIQGINTTIISPRRWGKSSLVEKVVKDINNNENTVYTVVIDLFSVSGEEEFLELFAREVIKASSSKWQDWVQAGKEFFKRLIPRLTVGIDPKVDFSIGFDWTELAKHHDEILNLPEKIAAKYNVNFIICLDEFQNLSAFMGYDNFEKKMRSIWQRQKNVTYCLYGSKRHMMASIFNNPSKPFYRFGDIMLLQKIETDKWIVFIVDGFKNSGKSISAENARIIASTMKDHPWYVQQLSHYTWQLTDKIAGKAEISKALNELINANTPLYQKEVDTISTTQLNLLKAVIKGETQFTGAAVMQKYKLGTPNNVLKNKKILMENDVIHEIDKHYWMLDPAFELWLLKQYFNVPFSI
ncbi:MAG: ATP-binding protein [Bacteroidetes bacterium HGW-Bacteroidetes-6]|jgi:hypothetical protein|nr:MAG: ATP-binding protein [Bacteroidetes bacterium HGW-Bacteroidetes-6]